MLILTILVFSVNWPWYLAWHIEEFTGYYPEWIVDFFGGITGGILDMFMKIG